MRDDIQRWGVYVQVIIDEQPKVTLAVRMGDIMQ